MTEDLVVKPRNVERHKIQAGEWKYPYQYDKVGAPPCSTLPG
jgi:hypothetical protein